MKITMVDIHTHNPREGVFSPTTAGVHPRLSDKVPFESVEDDLALADMVGETGLDKACGVDMQAQTRMFRLHAEAASALRKPLVVHCVRAFEETMRVLRDYDLPAVVFHGFIGSVQQASQAVARGYCLSFGLRSMLSPRSVGAMRSIPLERLFVETDDDARPVTQVYARAAELLALPEDELVKIVADNCRRIFPHKEL